MSRKIAIILFNLGGPDSKKAIRPFLFNFFMDKNIIALPTPFRFLLATYISHKRSQREAGISYGEINDKSPLLENTIAQSTALEKMLNEEDGNHNKYKSFVCMRYWHPMSDKIVKEVKNWGADKIVILPLYPQFSTTTTGSSLQTWNKEIANAGMQNIETSMICCYPENTAFIETSADHIKTEYDRAIEDGYSNPRILFSAHGLPEKIIKNGDPYQKQCEDGAAKIAKCLSDKLDVPTLDWQICYQSRVGRLKWIGPSTEQAIEQAAKDDKAIIIYPHAFTQEHVETIVELDIEYKLYAQKINQSGYYRAQTVGTNPIFIKGLSKLIQSRETRTGIESETQKRLCSDKFSRCLMCDKIM